MFILFLPNETSLITYSLGYLNIHIFEIRSSEGMTSKWHLIH